MDSSLVPYALLALPVLYVLLAVVRPSKRNLHHIPTVGGSPLPGLAWVGALRYIIRGGDVLQEGYAKYKGRAFKHAEISGWHVLVSGPRLVEELHRAPDDVLSFAEATNDSLAVDYTLAPSIHRDTYHVPIIRAQLTRALPVLFPAIHNEIVCAFADGVARAEVEGKTDNRWTRVRVTPTLMEIVARTSNRLFVGLPLCRNADYCALNKQFTIDVFWAARIINLFPAFLKPIAGRLLTNVPKSIARGITYLSPLIEERMRMSEEYGKDWADKPNDMLQWLMDEATGEERSVRALVLRLLTVNIAAIHTSSLTFTDALFLLAAHPQYIVPLREEVEELVQQEGWTKTAMNKMRKVDSFLKETQRYIGLGAKSITRKALKDFSFSDGTFIPAGTTVSAPSRAMHYDESIYADPEVFDPFRFSNMRDVDGEGSKHQMVSTSVDYVPFGHGRHACPGRFFAANELKAMLAHVVVTYDVRMEQEGVLPAHKWFGTSLVPDGTAEVLFRQRPSV